MRVILFIVSLLFTVQGVFSQGNSTVDLKITITGIKEVGGNVSVNLFKTSDGFPEDPSKAYLYKTIKADHSKESVYFMNLSPGIYAFAVLHDENENDEMDKNFLGIPTEGFAFSNNYKPKIKSPAFVDAAFSVEQKDTSVEVEMLYFL